MVRKNATKNIRRGPKQWPRKGNYEHKRRTTMMAKKKQPRTQPWPWQWLGGAQPRTQNHGDGQKKCN